MRWAWIASGGRWLRSLHDQSLGRKAGVVFLLIFLLAAANIIVVRLAIDRSDSVAAIVNVAGKMRMLSQRAAYHGQAAAQGWDAMGGRLRGDVADFEHAYRALSVGGEVFGMTVRPLEGALQEGLREVGGAWRQYREDALARHLTGGIPDDEDRARAFQALDAQAQAVLRATEELLVSLVDKEAAYRRSHLEALYLVFGLDLLLLLLASAAVRQYVLRPLRVLSGYCQELIRGNYAARVAYTPNDEIGQLARGLNDSARRTHELMKRIQTEHDNLLRAEALFQGVADNAAVGVIVVLNDMSLRYANGVYARMLGLEAGAPLYDSRVEDAFVARDRQRIKALLGGYLDGRLSTDRAHVFHLRSADGKGLPVELFCSSMRLGPDRAVVVLLMDVSERREAEAAAREASLVFESTSEAIVVTDAQGCVLNTNPAFSVITGYTQEEMLGVNMRVLSSGRQDGAFYQKLWEDLRVWGRWSGDLWNRRKDGQDYAEHLTINAVYDAEGGVRCFVGIFSDITQQKRSEDLIWRQAHYDSLTSLPNRQHFHLKLQEALERARASAHGSVALVFLDLDLFKEVNDTLGHEVGDTLLRAVAARIGGAVRENDVVARLGGDEFTLILEGIGGDSPAVDRILRDVLEALARPYLLSGQEVTVSASAGVTFHPEDGEEAGELLRNADLAMYAAKEGGRNQYRRFEPSMREAALMRRQLHRDLQSALAERQFHLLYQPIVELDTGRMVKVEALLRWSHPARGVLSPTAFIAQAEESGLIREIGDWVFREATMQLVAWRHALADGLQMSINVSPIQLLADGIQTGDWLAHLRELGVAPERLTVEITESLLMDMGPATQEKLLAFRDAGVQVALDDFGTGYSSLSYLNRFDIDYIKIDRTFVDALGAGTESLALCQAIIVMAHKLGLAVIAEGVSTTQQCELLRMAGCNYAQGYFFAQPLEPGGIKDLIGRRLL
ncbi:EAL domain-containing protein [Castellaniella sp. GW247-6E4]|uniref:EAL domain-containing protein n=1 Tax=Castellaniella sp. GW247-6E4 TaxID=3140380 RepID=UPI003315EF2B